MPEKPPKDTTSTNLVERDRVEIGFLHAIAFSDPADPAGDCARVQVGIGKEERRWWVDLDRARAQEFALGLLALTNGNWVGVTEAELEVRHGQLRLELERAHG